MSNFDFCAICYEEDCVFDGPANRGGEDVYQRALCNHLICVDCLREMCDRGQWKCPFCRCDWDEYFSDLCEEYDDSDTLSDEETSCPSIAE